MTNVPAGLSNVISLVAGDYHTLALKTDGTVVAWGAGGLFPSPNIGHQELIANLFVVQVPEPPTLGLFALGALLLGWRWRKYRS